MNKTYRSLPFTSWDLDLVQAWVPNDKKVRFLVGQTEMCPSTGKKHFQGYIEFQYPMRPSYLKKLFGQRCNIRFDQRGDAEENIAYVTKEASRLPEDDEEAFSIYYGTHLEQGQRSDIVRLVDLTRSGASDRQIATEMPTEFVKYGNSIDRIRLAFAEPRNEMPVAHVVWGVTNSGKTHEAKRIAGPNAYVKSNNNFKWWPNYITGQPVIIDEFRDTWCRIDELLSLINWIEMTVEVNFF